MMTQSFPNGPAEPMIVLAALASLIQLTLVIIGVLALRRMAAAQEATARHLEQILEVVAGTDRSSL
jgi:hypothetical protein